MQHYVHRFAAKSSGGVRLIEEPKPRLKAIQRRILHEMLDAVPVHEKAYGFVRGRSIHAAAQVHAGEHVVISLDLRDFFMSSDIGSVHHLFRRIGYPWSVARALTGICTSITPSSVFDRLPPGQRPPHRVIRRCGSQHLPQGAPTSPALANLVAGRMDARLQGLAESFCANYSRYADDISFSGDAAFDRGREPFLAAVRDIVSDEGFELNSGKTRIARRHERQQVLGLVVNDGLNNARPSYDELKAILHNCRTKGWRAQNREARKDFRAHLDGRIAWVESVNHARGFRLRAAFEAIDWS